MVLRQRAERELLWSTAREFARDAGGRQAEGGRPAAGVASADAGQSAPAPMAGDAEEAASDDFSHGRMMWFGGSRLRRSGAGTDPAMASARSDIGSPCPGVRAHRDPIDDVAGQQHGHGVDAMLLADGMRVLVHPAAGNWRGERLLAAVQPEFVVMYHLRVISIQNEILTWLRFYLHF
jgi:hypothetical protein